MPAPRRFLALIPAAAAVGLLLGSGPAAADMLQTRDGRVVEGVKMEREGQNLLLKYLHGTVTVPLAQVEDFVIEGAPPPEPANDEERAKRAQGLVPFRRKWIPVAERDKAVKKEADERKKALAEQAKHSQWMNRYQFKTKNFEFESTLPPSVNDDFSELLETYFREFGKTWKTHLPQGWGRLNVDFYSNEEEFLKATGVPRGVLAYYRFVEPRELDFYYDRRNVSMCISTLYHEANHYLTHLLNDKFHYPHWVNESMAEYYGASVWDPVKKTMVLGGVQQGRLAEVRSDIDSGKKQNLKDLVADESGAYEHYYWGWSLVHFLMEDPKYRPKFMKFFADLATAPDVERRPLQGLAPMVEVKGGKETLRVFLSRMGLKEENLPDLQKAWYAHIDSMDATSVRGLEEGGIRSFRDGKWKFKAPRLLKSAIDAGSRNIEAYIAYAQCLEIKGDPESLTAAAEALEKAIGIDPLDADIRAEQGYLLWVPGKMEEGEQAVDLAREMNPDNDYITIEVRKKLAEVGNAAGGGE